MSSSGRRPPSGSVVSSLKHKLSKREYKDVLSKTYIGTILLMHMYQGKGRWGFIAEVPALTWLVLYYDFQSEVRTVHESKYQVSNQYTTMDISWTSPRGSTP